MRIRCFTYFSISIYLVFSVLGCNLYDNSIKGEFYSEIAAPIATGVSLKLDNCFTAPPENLPYSCQAEVEAVYESSLSASSPMEVTSDHLARLATLIQFETVANSCTGISIDASGMLSGTLVKTVAETCSLTVLISSGTFTVQKTLSFTVAPSLSFSFDQENVFLQEGAAAQTTLTLSLSAPAPYDTFVDFEVFGAQEVVVSGISFETHRIEIFKGQSEVSFSLAVSPVGGLSAPISQQIRITSGGTGALPGVSLNSYKNNIVFPSFEELNSGYYHSCGIDDGKLYCWGKNSDGQVGIGDATVATVGTPTRIGVDTTWSKVSGGNDHTCGINLGELYCWGLDSFAQLGNGIGQTDTAVPTKIGSSNTWSDIFVGGRHSCGIDNGFLWCWGQNFQGQVGNGMFGGADIDIPVQIGGSNLWESGSARNDSSCAIDNGFLFCWGANLYGNVGNGTTNFYVANPSAVGLSNEWTSIGAGAEHTCGIDGGKLFCWGSDTYGQQGNGSAGAGDILSHSQIGTSSSWTEVFSGEYHSCGINGGELFCWGWDTGQQIGNGNDTTALVESPVKIGTSTMWTKLAPGGFHTCGIKSGRLHCWGSDNFGQVGNGGADNQLSVSPSQVGQSKLWTNVYAAAGNTCGIRDSQLYCWGSDSVGALGNGILSQYNSGVPLAVGVPTSWMDIAIGGGSVCGIKYGSLYCWGWDVYGRIGNGPLNTSDVHAPEKIGALENWTAVSLGRYHTCGIESGALYCWGYDSVGQLGNGAALAAFDVPDQVGASSTWSAISLYESSSCGINQGQLFCWGSDSDEQLGDGVGTTDSPIPVLIGSSSLWTAISLGATHACGINAGQLYCWGADDQGQVGNGGGAAVVTAPLQIGVSSLWSHISLGDEHSCGILAGELFCWGSDSTGQLGNGLPTANVESPIQIGTSALWTQIGIGGDHSCGIREGKNYCWGANSMGQLGNNSSFLGTPFLLMNW